MKKQICIISLLFLCGFFIAPVVSAEDYQFERMAKAVADECYTGFGNPYHDIDDCPDGGIPKRNQTYGWSMAMWGNDIWIGTGGNSGFVFTTGLAPSENLAVKEVPGVVAIEGRHSQYPGIPFLLRPYLGDWRPPQVWLYDRTTKTQTEVTPNDPLIKHTLGLRAAGECDGVILLAGASRVNLGINIFAFDAKSRKYLGSRFFPEYCGIRNFVTIKDVLYTSVLATSVQPKGIVLAWTGNNKNPFEFREVGKIDGMGSNIVEHNGRIFINTWPVSIQGSLLGIFTWYAPEAGIWMSPVIPDKGFTKADIIKWKKVWKASDYEPEPIVAGVYAMGNMASFGGYLYWGTMHNNPYSIYALCRYKVCPKDQNQALQYATRHPAIFRCSDFEQDTDNPAVELLYGEKQMYVLTPSASVINSSDEWSLADNNMGGIQPLYGPSGFGTNVTYIWSMAIHGNKLFVGTDGTESIPDGLMPIKASLWSFNDAHSPAVLIDKTGLGNQYNGGLRNLRSTEEGLFILTVNHANINPEGGWELVKMTTIK